MAVPFSIKKVLGKKGDKEHILVDAEPPVPNKFRFLHVKNYYCGSLQIHWRCVGTDWTEGPEMTLMPNPHYEEDAQRWFAIDLAEVSARIPFSKLEAIRFELRQPSPLWKSYSLSEVRGVEDEAFRQHSLKHHGGEKGVMLSLVESGADLGRAVSSIIGNIP
mmetsp:Transcript_2446/g.5079  ORF Transcript_2446/g.5079 Transcript_2446/m.5079 type:complete len:162 (-) Transcript_2446:379-864(-)|eukprot:CAMPEP_0113867732 /NCGR_PEP_ID=MMETSP0780_2-20120614/585_1 /TAXON_ID=652834 /ORGANISM="Palpitomonas bilix" /LENGTH=161 /DNA_ID=CAMNT_0000852713 /DNA_START=194 /DNA_END=679 /DNA_ORIENTATION=- /assembly_acc=CAM_ASM_000599